MTVTTTIEAPMMLTTMVGRQSSAFGFLDLPTEIRLEVYSHLFEAAKLSCGTPHISWPACNYAICSCLFPRQITSTCRQLRDEALPLLMSSTTVEVAGSFEKVITMPQNYLESINKAVVLDAKLFSRQPFELGRMPALQVLEIRNIDVWCKFYDEVYLESEAADEAMHDMALFNVKRLGATLLELCRISRPFKVHLCCQFVVNSLSDETIVSPSKGI